MDQRNPDFLKSVRDFASTMVDGQARVMKSFVSLWAPTAGSGSSGPATYAEEATRCADTYIDLTARYYDGLIHLGHSYATSLVKSVDAAVKEAVEPERGTGGARKAR